MSYFRQLPAFLLGAIPLSVLFDHYFGGEWWFAGFVVGGLLTALPIDKFIDDQYRTLEKCESERTT